MVSYRILTWDTDAQEFTPQDGVPEYVAGLGGLRRAIRELRSMGYSAHRVDEYDNDPATLIERVEKS